jgi:hypothetical protein
MSKTSSLPKSTRTTIYGGILPNSKLHQKSSSNQPYNKQHQAELNLLNMFYTKRIDINSQCLHCQEAKSDGHPRKIVTSVCLVVNTERAANAAGVKKLRPFQRL